MKILCEKLKWEKAIITVMLGFLAVYFCRSPFPIVLDIIYNTKYKWYLIIPMLVSEAWGTPYAVLISVLGGCATMLPFIEQPSRGFGNIIVCIAYMILFFLCSFCEKKVKKSLHYYLAFFVYCIFYYVLFDVFYLPLINQNPISPDYILSASPTILRIVTITNAFSILSFAAIVKVMLELPPVRRMMGLEPLENAENNLKNFLYVVLVVLSFLIVDSFFESFYFYSRGIHTFILTNSQGSLMRIPLVSSVLFIISDVLILNSMQTLGDMRKQKEAEQKIIELNEGLEQAVEERTVSMRNAYHDLESFSYTMTHELKTPVRELNAYLEIIEEDNEDVLSDQSKEDIHSAEKVCTGTLEMIEKMMIYTRAGFMTLNMEKTDVRQMAEKCFSEFKRADQGQEMELEITDLPPLYSDAFLLKVAISNILSNSLKFSKCREKIIIRVDSAIEEDRIVYRFSDNGVGFEPGNNNKLFELFNRAHNANEYAGSGIGLALVKRIVNRLGGDVSIEGRPDEGCTVYLKFNRKLMV